MMSFFPSLPPRIGSPGLRFEELFDSTGNRNGELEVGGKVGADKHRHEATISGVSRALSELDVTSGDA
jgi:hypothetical protein